MSNITFEKAGEGKVFKPVEAGKHDAILHAIIELGVHPKTYSGETTSSVQVKFVFELPSELNDDGTTRVVGKQVKASLHEKSKFMEISRALLQSTNDDDIVEQISGNIDILIGKPVVLTVKQFTTDSGKLVSYIDKVSELDSRLPSQPEAVRDGFVFSTKNADAAEVFKNKLTDYTRKTIMEAENSKDYPSSIHETYASLLEDSVANKVLG